MSVSLGSPYSPIRPTSRSSSRNSNRSFRTHSPSLSPSLSSDDPVAVRNQISTLRHSIRLQQAQLHSLEDIILAGPRPLPLGFMMPLSPGTTTQDDSVLDISPYPAPGTPKMQRRNSHDHLQGLAGRDSGLPLPLQQDGIREGVPTDFGTPSKDAMRRQHSLDRSLSRIPVSSVGNARALAEEGNPANRGMSPTPPSPSGRDGGRLSVMSPTGQPSSPNKRLSFTPGGTTRVLADLQTGVINARNALENTKSQLRLSQRTVAQLTRQTEDLKESRERLRLENEGLNNVVARKERLLQEVLERARKAEAEAASMKSQLKTETSASKKSLREMEASLAESTALSQKSEREYVTLRDSIKSMAEGWKVDTERLREEMRRREDMLKKEAEMMGQKYQRLVAEVRAADGQRESMRELKHAHENIRKEAEDCFRLEIGQLRTQTEEFSKKSDESNQIAKCLASELARLRRLMQAAGRSPPQSMIMDDSAPDVSASADGSS
ncbi:hypothetical protein CONPUDRAFT_132015 [Coniophora puteana RWD-64-598 SS2]|uniref:SWI5-dependent HO expression protein 3 n=1 Tax=Coniophora puteana (strain RWD-64-598) TaxID=741705 RepID=A0A5M3M8W4_CONPW|nr:uncharacterized protein CONPUDRAFT_132015 [Coniophora puteana RWD-64-598 SS2]EIW75081.1 hypothetical protein CONPUDRAFT_132015 [Coniophora puteana RWD-64-598 SS2]